MLAIYEFYWDCGRQGNVSGLFVADKDEVKSFIGKEVYFGEILGKHSDVHGVLEDSDFEIKTEDQDFISKFVEIMGDGTISGYNPIEQIKQEMEDGVYD